MISARNLNFEIDRETAEEILIALEEGVIDSEVALNYLTGPAAEARQFAEDFKEGS